MEQHRPVATVPPPDYRDPPTTFTSHSPDNVGFIPPPFPTQRARSPPPLPHRSLPPPPPNDSKNTCYYSYGQLRPLILPLILGRVEEETFHGIKKRCSNNRDDTTHMVPPSPTKPPQKDCVSKASQPVAPSDASQKIKSVLEINCGLNPLSLSIQNDLLSLQQVTGLNATLVVNKIVCCDDDERNIDYLLDQSEEKNSNCSDDDEEDEEIVKIMEKDGRWRLKRRRDQHHFSSTGNKKPMLCMSTDDEDSEEGKGQAICPDTKKTAAQTTLELHDDNRMVSLSPSLNTHNDEKHQGKDKIGDNDDSSKETQKAEEKSRPQEQVLSSELPSSPQRPMDTAPAGSSSSSYQQITPPYKKQSHVCSNNGPQKELDVEYVVANASQQIPYGNDEFHLIIEKGMGLDVMTHPHLHPYYWQERERVIMMVTEMARVLAEGGYMMTVSRTNADSEEGRIWINEIIIPALRAGGGDAMWEIEVHAFSDNDADEDEDADDEETTRSEGRGHEEYKEETDAYDDERPSKLWETDRSKLEGVTPPSVYIIHKMPPFNHSKDQADHRDDAGENDKNNCRSSQTMAIPLNFVTYSHNHLNGFQP